MLDSDDQIMSTWFYQYSILPGIHSCKKVQMLGNFRIHNLAYIHYYMSVLVCDSSWWWASILGKYIIEVIEVLGFKPSLVFEGVWTLAFSFSGCLCTVGTQCWLGKSDWLGFPVIWVEYLALHFAIHVVFGGSTDGKNLKGKEGQWPEMEENKSEVLMDYTVCLLT